MDGPEVSAQHPYSRVKPLQGGESINKEQVPRVVKTDMFPFMSENRSITGFVIATVHHDIMHPTERRQRCVTGHADRSSVSLRM